MSYPKTGQEVYVSLNLSNTMLTGIGKGTITREEVSVDYLKRLFAEHGVIVSAKPEQHRLLEIVNATFDLGLELPEELKLFQLSEQHRRLVVINVQGPVSYTHLAGSGGSGQRHGVLPRPAESDRRAVRRHGGSLPVSYTHLKEWRISFTLAGSNPAFSKISEKCKIDIIFPQLTSIISR